MVRIAVRTLTLNVYKGIELDVHQRTGEASPLLGLDM